MNEYVGKYNELQDSHSQFHISFYKVQQERDNLTTDLIELKKRVETLKNQLEA